MDSRGKLAAQIEGSTPGCGGLGTAGPLICHLGGSAKGQGIQLVMGNEDQHMLSHLVPVKRIAIAPHLLKA